MKHETKCNSANKQCELFNEQKDTTEGLTECKM